MSNKEKVDAALVLESDIYNIKEDADLNRFAALKLHDLFFSGEPMSPTNGTYFLLRYDEAMNFMLILLDYSKKVCDALDALDEIASSDREEKKN